MPTAVFPQLMCAYKTQWHCKITGGTISCVHFAKLCIFTDEEQYCAVHLQSCCVLSSDFSSFPLLPHDLILCTIFLDCQAALTVVAGITCSRVVSCFLLSPCGLISCTTVLNCQVALTVVAGITCSRAVSCFCTSAAALCFCKTGASCCCIA